VLEWLIENRDRVVNMEGITCSQDFGAGETSQLNIDVFIGDPSYPKRCPVQWADLIARNESTN